MYPTSTPLGYDSESNFFITLAEQYGNPYTSSNGDHCLFNNEGNKAFVAKFAEWYQKGWITTQNLYGAYTSDLFIKENNEVGKVFMCVASSAGARYQRPNKINGEYPFEVGIVPVPQVDLYNPKVISQGPSLCIFKDDNIQETYASWLFLKFLTTDTQFQAQYSMKSGYIPVIKSATETPVYNSFLEKADGGDFIVSLAIKVALEQKDYYFSTPAFVGSAVARENVGLLLHSVFARWVLGADNSAMIDEQFLKYYNYCKEND
jgi:multiple sugar transport system substrate-binding protein